MIHQNLYQLNQRWKFHKVGDDKWYDATVPGCVHQDLFINDLIPDPFVRCNEKKLQWIMENQWTYCLLFALPKEIMDKKHKVISFSGIDTYADIFLNGVKILSTNNMFHPWEKDISNLLHRETNELKVIFRSPIEEVLPLMNERQYKLPADNDQAGKTSPYTRKAPYHYGWDWGPCFVTSGIWKNVGIFGWNDWYVNFLSLTNTSCSIGSAELNLECEIISEKNLQLDLTISEDKSDLKIVQKIDLKVGKNTFSKNFQITDPKLWWPAGHGNQPLYDFEILLGEKNKTERIVKRIGLRKIKIKREKSKSGKSFEIHVNDTPIFSKGANWIPADSFVTRLKDEDYRSLLESAIDANMNTLRIWGGGIYEPDIFYELCDELGILVWQDFMFACSMYPASDEFLQSVEKEARYQVRRLKEHPSIILWCGNNEIASGWLSWGWKEELPKSVWDDYRQLFHELLPRVCDDLDPNRFYWPSSPGHSVDLPDSDQIYGSGDNHYWGVWHGGDGFDAFENNVGRFMSEYGMQSFPEQKTIKYFAEDEDMHLESSVMIDRQKASLGTGNLIKYIEKYYPLPKTFESIAGLSQIMQAHSIKKAVEVHRKNMPFCMGTLYWQLNDCWPAISWSSLDYFGNWKALHYEAKRFFSPTLLTLSEKDKDIEIFIINDQNKAFKVTLNVLLYNFNSKVMMERSQKVNVSPLSSKRALKEDRSILLDQASESEVFLHAYIEDNAGTISKANYYFTDQKYLKTPQPKFDYSYNDLNDLISFKIQANSFIQQLHITCLNEQGNFSDNYFDILKGEAVEINFYPKQKPHSKAENIIFQIRTLHDLIEDSEPRLISFKRREDE